VPRIPAETRDAVITAIRAGTKSRNQIARDHDISVGSVTNIAKAAGMTDAFDRSETAKATRAAVEDNRARRARIAAELLDDVDRFRERAWSKYTYYERGSDGPELVSLDLPPLKEAKEAYVAIGISLQRHAELEKLDADRGDEGARSMLGDLATALKQMAARDTSQ
jgi:hypothetical protein